MKYLKIQNDGVLDENLIFLMGASTKSNDSSKIGQFGTGLKYSLTWLLRNNVDFKLFLGEREIRIDTIPVKIKDSSFDVVRIEGKESSVTTKMGQDWKAWMILRELWCNAIDEGGQVIEVVDEACGLPDKTAFFVQLTGEIQQAYKDWDKYFNTRRPVFENDDHKVYASEGKTMKIYRKGILVAEYKDTDSVFDYDICHAPINELREYTGYLDLDICYCFAELDGKAITYLIENLTDNKREAKMDLSYSNFENWKHALGNAKVISYESFRVLQEMKPESMAESRFVQLPSNLYKKLCKDIPNVSALMTSHDAHTFFEVIDSKLSQNLKQALTILEACNYYVEAELTFITGIFNDKSVLARINLKDRTVMLSTTLRDMGLKELIYAIVEETEHFRTSFYDNTREFQTHFIKLYVNSVLESNEVKL